jgi:Ca-activated chloride channel homolog
LKRLAQCLALALASSSAFAGGWPDLWRTPDQQGQHLLDAGRFAEAAGVFTDPRRRAYAEIKAGHFAEAANQLAPYNDAASEYNRGNALARAGDLQGALSAYDAALSRTPHDHDAQHNRDLVARALQQDQHDAAAGQQKKGSQPQNPSPQGSPSSQSGQSPDTRSASAQPSPGTSSGKQSPGSRSTGAGSPQPGHEPSNRETGADGNHESAAESDHRDSLSSAPQPGQQEARGNPRPQARDQTAGSDQSKGNLNAAAHTQAKPPPAGLAAQPDAAEALGPTPQPRTETERSISLEQWLRQIPDDSGELLRRKFLIEHAMRQQEGQP